MRCQADDRDIRITPAQRAYLVAFENWLHTVWKQAPADHPTTDLATGLKNATLADLLRKEAPQVALRIINELPPLGCKGCGDELPERSGPGRPRKYCTTCRPAARPRALALAA